jgi:CubicO group peptidase (beta-lactamase class C family)
MDLAIFPTDQWIEMGLPEVPQGTGPTCSGLPGTKACTKEDLFEDIGRRPPVFLPQTSPSYSNLAYALLGLVIEAATGETFEDVVKANIWDVAGMESTSFNGPVNAFEQDGFVPMGEPTWNVTLGVFEA